MDAFKHARKRAWDWPHGAIERIVLLTAALMSAMCSGDSSPTSPTESASALTVPAQPVQTPPPPPPAPALPGKVEVSVRPNPVPFSGQSIADVASCASSKNTWFYDLQLREVAGTQVTLHSRVDTFDGSTVNNLTGLNIVVPANDAVSLRLRWCSATSGPHSAQTSFTGTDAHGNSLTLTSPVATLAKP